MLMHNAIYYYSRPYDLDCDDCVADVTAVFIIALCTEPYVEVAIGNRISRLPFECSSYKETRPVVLSRFRNTMAVLHCFVLVVLANGKVCSLRVRPHPGAAVRKK